MGEITLEKYLRQKAHQGPSHWEENIVRYLIPFDLLELVYDKYVNSGKLSTIISIQSNSYKCEMKPTYEDDSCRKYRIHVHAEKINDDYNKLITIFDDFEVVFDKVGDNKERFATVYPIGQGIEKPIYEKIENQLLNHEFDKLAAYQSKHFNDFLAMILIQNIVKESILKSKYSYPHLTVDPVTKMIKLADSNDLKHQILYVFDKKDADALVGEFAPRGNNDKYDSYLSKNYRHIVYFVNTDFENFGHRKVENENAESISIKALMVNLGVPLKKWSKYELAVLYLSYNHNQEKLDWINNPYVLPVLKTRIEENATNTKENESISCSLFQDALNTLSTSKHLNYFFDYFLFVCAANLVNRKFNDIMEPLKSKPKEVFFEQKKKLNGCKKHIFDIFRSWMKEKPSGIYICMGRFSNDGIPSNDITVLVNMKVYNRRFQFRFRMNGGGKEKEYMQELESFAKTNGIRVNGEDSGINLQPIAQTLYQYAYLLKLGMK